MRLHNGYVNLLDGSKIDGVVEIDNNVYDQEIGDKVNVTQDTYNELIDILDKVDAKCYYDPTNDMVILHPETNAGQDWGNLSLAFKLDDYKEGNLTNLATYYPGNGASGFSGISRKYDLDSMVGLGLTGSQKILTQEEKAENMINRNGGTVSVVSGSSLNRTVENGNGVVGANNIVDDWIERLGLNENIESESIFCFSDGGMGAIENVVEKLKEDPNGYHSIVSFDSTHMYEKIEEHISDFENVPAGHLTVMFYSTQDKEFNDYASGNRGNPNALKDIKANVIFTKTPYAHGDGEGGIANVLDQENAWTLGTDNFDNFNPSDDYIYEYYRYNSITGEYDSVKYISLEDVNEILKIGNVVDVDKYINDQISSGSINNFVLANYIVNDIGIVKSDNEYLDSILGNIRSAIYSSSLTDAESVDSYGSNSLVPTQEGPVISSTINSCLILTTKLCQELNSIASVGKIIYEKDKALASKLNLKEERLKYYDNK